MRTGAFVLMIVMLAASFVASTDLYAYDPSDPKPTLAHVVPSELEGVEVKQDRLGTQINLGREFVDASGAPVTLGKYFDNHKPTILSIVYYTCPSLCNFHLNGLFDTFGQMKWNMGHDFNVVAVTMNHRETPKDAMKKTTSFIKEYNRADASSGLHLLTGTEENIKALSKELGFGFKYIEATGEYAHASVAYIMTPGGQISRMLQGIEFPVQTMKLALLEASNGKIGNVVDQILLFCFQFDPTKNKYTLYAWNIMQAGAIFILLALGVFLIPVWVRARKSQRVEEK